MSFIASDPKTGFNPTDIKETFKKINVGTGSPNSFSITPTKETRDDPPFTKYCWRRYTFVLYLPKQVVWVPQPGGGYTANIPFNCDGLQGFLKKECKCAGKTFPMFSPNPEWIEEVPNTSCVELTMIRVNEECLCETIENNPCVSSDYPDWEYSWPNPEAPGSVTVTTPARTIDEELVHDIYVSIARDFFIDAIDAAKRDGHDTWCDCGEI